MQCDAALEKYEKHEKGMTRVGRNLSDSSLMYIPHFTSLILVMKHFKTPEQRMHLIISKVLFVRPPLSSIWSVTQEVTFFGTFGMLGAKSPGREPTCPSAWMLCRRREAAAAAVGVSPAQAAGT